MRNDVFKAKDSDSVFNQIFPNSDVGVPEGLEKLEPKSADWKTEKHVPIVEKTENGIKVTVGSTLHPMVEDHWITMIEVIDGDTLYRKYLNPGDQPIAEFPIENTNVKAREYCNKHGLWSN